MFRLLISNCSSTHVHQLAASSSFNPCKNIHPDPPILRFDGDDVIVALPLGSEPLASA